jgi:hypothetical protein
MDYMEKVYKNTPLRKKFKTKTSWAGMSVNDCIIQIMEIYKTQNYIFTKKNDPPFRTQNLRELWLHFLDWKRMGDSMQISYIKEYYCQIGKEIKDHNKVEQFPLIVFTSQDVLACCIAKVRMIPVLFNTGSSIRYYFDFPTLSPLIKENSDEYHYLKYINEKIVSFFYKESSTNQSLINQFAEYFHKWYCNIDRSFMELEDDISKIYTETLPQIKPDEVNKYEEEVKKYTVLTLRGIKEELNNFGKQMDELIKIKDTIQIKDIINKYRTMYYESKNIAYNLEEKLEEDAGIIHNKICDNGEESKKIREELINLYLNNR